MAIVEGRDVLKLGEIKKKVGTGKANENMGKEMES
jgi:hypothetical protein